MEHIDSRCIGDFTIRIDRLLCVGFEDCLGGEPSLFDLDEEGIAIFHADSDRVTAERILEVCRSCPVDALEVISESGESVVP